VSRRFEIEEALQLGNVVRLDPATQGKDHRVVRLPLDFQHEIFPKIIFVSSIAIELPVLSDSRDVP
jgi:hypothetical protein